MLALNVSVPVERLVSVTANVFVWPPPNGTAPKLTLTGSSETMAPTAVSRFSRPLPMTLTLVSVTSGLNLLYFFSTPWSAVLTIAERTSAADQSGCSPRTTAADPARCGVAIDVPWKNAKHGGASQKVCGIELSTLTPGATTSGFTRKSTSVGPRLLNPAMMSALVVRKYCSVAPIVVESVSAAMSAGASDTDTM